MRRTLATVALVALAVSGCGGSESAADSPTSAAPSPTVGTVTLAQTCPAIEAASPEEFSPLVEVGEWVAFRGKLEEIRNAGDLESQNAVDLVLPAIDTWIEVPDQGQPTVDAAEKYRGAIETLAGRCRTAGSSAFQ